MRVFILLLSIRYNMCVCIQYITTSSLLLSTSHNVPPGIICTWCVCWSYCCLSGTMCVYYDPVCYYITATAVCLTQRSQLLASMIFLGWIVIACTAVCTVSQLVLVERAVWGATLDKHHACLVFCIACICELPWDITMLMWTIIVNSLSKVADHPMSSPCWVDRVGPVFAYRTMHLNDVVPASSPMISVSYTHLTLPTICSV